MSEIPDLVWGAVIALVATVIGGFMSSVVAPLLNQRATNKAREREGLEDRRAVLQQTFLDTSVALRAYWLASTDTDDKATLERLLDAEQLMLKIKLWTAHEEAAIGTCLARVLAVHGANKIAAMSYAWEQIASTWFRGALANKDIEKEFDRVVTERLAYLEELDERS